MSSRQQRRALFLGEGGFIGSHLTRRLCGEGYHVRGVDLKLPEFSPTAMSEFILADLRDRLGWEPASRLVDGLARFYACIEAQKRGVHDSGGQT